MKICLIASEYFQYGKYGGFGTMARNLAIGLKEKGVEISVVVRKVAGQQDIEEKEGIKIFAYPTRTPWKSKQIYQKINADIYHSQEPNLGTYYAQKTMPSKKHIITCIDPRTLYDWYVEWKFFNLKRKIIFPAIMLFELNPLVIASIKNADKIYCQTKYIMHKVGKLYGVRNRVLGFLPNPVRAPKKIEIKKAEKPTCLFLARLDKRKRPVLFLELAKRFPGIDFIMAGVAKDKSWDRYLRDTYANEPNINMVGLLDQFNSDEFSKTLEKSWILINTSAREGLPASFVEALSYKCAILSSVNPDNFASDFGYFVQDNNFDIGLARLLENALWKDKAAKGYEYFMKEYEFNQVIDKHINEYRKILNKG